METGMGPEFDFRPWIETLPTPRLLGRDWHTPPSTHWAELPQAGSQNGATGFSTRQDPLFANSCQATGEGVGPLFTWPELEV
jgi:hypothetical protein